MTFTCNGVFSQYGIAIYTAGYLNGPKSSEYFT